MSRSFDWKIENENVIYFDENPNKKTTTFYSVSLQFSILLIVIFLVEIGVGITGYTKHDQLKNILDKGFNKTFNQYEQNQQAWQLLQTEVRTDFDFLFASK